jgi:hemolysin activation/secretion protein
MPAEELVDVLTLHQGKDITQDNLRRAIDAVSELYRSKHLLALVEMPPQDLSDGMPQIQITEARFSGLVVEDPTGQLANNPHLPAQTVERVQARGELLSLPALDEAATALNDIPGVSAKMSLRPGDKAGETQAVVVLASSQPVQATVSMDNAGARATGEWRESTRLTFNNPLKMGDTASLQQVHSQGLDYLRAAYSVPVGGSGWRAGINASGTKYQVISPEMQSLNVRGPSSTVGMDLTMPLARTAQETLTWQLAADQRQYRNDALDVMQSNYRGSTLSSYLESTRKTLPSAETTASLLLVKGHLDLSPSTVAHQTWDALTTQTQGSYAKSRVAVMHRQDVGASNTFVASVQAQSASKNLDASEKFFLGGPQGVRAYATNEAGGSQGYLASLEWQHHFSGMPQQVTAAGFVDTGRITINKFNDYAGAPAVNHYGLSGAGFWIGTSIPNRYGLTTMRLTASQRLGLNPGALPQSGLDQDGKHVLNRIWYSLSQTF